VTEWWDYTKRFLSIFLVFFIGGLILTLAPNFLVGAGIFRSSFLEQILIVPISYRLGLVLFLEAALLLFFAGALAVGLGERIAVARYAVDPTVTRDTRRHYDSRRGEQSRSAPIIALVGIVFLIVAFYFLMFIPF
jgi:hypothetical protein